MYNTVLVTLLIAICLCGKFMKDNRESFLFSKLPLKWVIISELFIVLFYLASSYIATIKFQFYETIAIISIAILFYYAVGKFDWEIHQLRNINFKFLLISIWVIIVLFMVIGNELNKLIDISNKTFSKKSILIAIIIYLFTIMGSCVTNYYFNKDYKNDNTKVKHNKSPSERNVINSFFFVKLISIGMLLPVYLLKQIDTLIGKFITFQSSFIIEKGVLLLDAVLSFSASVLLIYVIYLLTLKFIQNNRSFHTILIKFIEYDNFYDIIKKHIK